MKVGFIITGRMKSTRLKKKLTLKIQNREIIAWMIDRAKLYFKDSEIVIATSNNPQDDILEKIANRENINVFRGHEEDVILRLYNAAKKNKFDYFINITADCPLFGFDYINDILDIHKTKNADLVTSIDFPHGIFTYGVKTSALKEIIRFKSTEQTEVWGDYFYKNTDKFIVKKLEAPKHQQRNTYRLTLDYPEDFVFFEKVYGHFGLNTYKTSSNDIIKYLDDNPEVVKINSNCKELYEKRWQGQRVSKIENEDE